MKPIPNTKYPLVLRIDFSNDAAWDAICSVIREPVGIFRFQANVEFLDDAEYENIGKNHLLGLLAKNYNHTFIFVVDEQAVALSDFPILVIDLSKGSEREFRSVPSEIQGIENNLSLGNMDFEEFASAVDGSGVFHGFPE